jgi:uncharacterized membrane protein YgdD (TMEM256/DUF423 family)
MNKKILIFASVFGLLAVITGAFGAHALKKIVTVEMLSVWQTGVQYQFYHTLALLFLSALSGIKRTYLNLSYQFFVTGIILFSGSLYLLALKDYLELPWLRFLGPVTPIGGGFLIMGWAALLIGAIKSDK